MNKNVVRNEWLRKLTPQDRNEDFINIVLDVETTLAKGNETLIFDLGWTISNQETGENLMHRSFIVREVFLDMEIMKRAHYFEKYPQYIEALISGNTELMEWESVVETLLDDIAHFEYPQLYAYNAGFDKGAINDTHEYLTTESLDLDFKCIMVGAIDTIMNTDDYITKAYLFDMLSDSGNVKTGAEFIYRYLTNNYEYIEEHTGLEDTLIETDILQEVLKRNDNVNMDIGRLNWKTVNNYRDKLGYAIIKRVQPKEKKERKWLMLENAKNEVIKLENKTITIEVEEK